VLEVLPELAEERCAVTVGDEMSAMQTPAAKFTMVQEYTLGNIKASGREHETERTPSHCSCIRMDLTISWDKISAGCHTSLGSERMSMEEWYTRQSARWRGTHWVNRKRGGMKPRSCSACRTVKMERLG
jgi:hypothetical protein